MITAKPINALERILKGQIDFENDTFKAILLSGLTFDPDTHGNLAAITANQIATKNGYTQNDKTLSGVAINPITASDLARVTWATFAWTADTSTDATGFGPFTTMAIYDDTVADKTVVAHVDFEGTNTPTDGVVVTITTPTIDLG